MQCSLERLVWHVHTTLGRWLEGAADVWKTSYKRHNNNAMFVRLVGKVSSISSVCCLCLRSFSHSLSMCFFKKASRLTDWESSSADTRDATFSWPHFVSPVQWSLFAYESPLPSLRGNVHLLLDVQIPSREPLQLTAVHYYEQLLRESAKLKTSSKNAEWRRQWRKKLAREGQSCQSTVSMCLTSPYLLPLCSQLQSICFCWRHSAATIQFMPNIKSVGRERQYVVLSDCPCTTTAILLIILLFHSMCLPLWWASSKSRLDETRKAHWRG